MGRRRIWRFAPCSFEGGGGVAGGGEVRWLLRCHVTLCGSQQEVTRRCELMLSVVSTSFALIVKECRGGPRKKKTQNNHQPSAAFFHVSLWICAKRWRPTGSWGGCRSDSGWDTNWSLSNVWCELYLYPADGGWAKSSSSMAEEKKIFMFVDSEMTFHFANFSLLYLNTSCCESMPLLFSLCLASRLTVYHVTPDVMLDSPTADWSQPSHSHCSVFETEFLAHSGKGSSLTALIWKKKKEGLINTKWWTAYVMPSGIFISSVSAVKLFFCFF